MLSDKQKQQREQSLGSSDAPVVAGVSPYKSPLELYYQLEGSLPRYTDEETQAQRIGSKLEPMIAELVAEDLGYKIRRCPTRRHPKHPFMVAHLDFEIVGGIKGPGVLEIKNRGASKPFDTLPDDITLQVVQQMAVTNRDWAVVAVLFGFGTLKTYDVQRDKELEEYLIELEARFMMRVQRSEPPDHTWTPETVGLLKKLYPSDSGTTIDLPAQFNLTAAGFLLAKQKIDEAEELKARYEGELKSAIGAASIAMLPEHQVVWKSTKPIKDFDEKAFAKECPELYAKFSITRPGYRRFTVRPLKEMIL